MENNSHKITFYKKELSSPKLSFIFDVFLNDIEDYKFGLFIQGNIDPLTQIISNFDEIQELLNIKEQKIMKLFYFNKTKLHNILYYEEEIINVDLFGISKDLSFYFYLVLLIKEDQLVVNYSYSINFIKDIHMMNINEDKIYKKIIISKTIIDLINNYKNTDNFNEEEEEIILNKIEKNNEMIIKNNNIDYFKNLSLNQIIHKNIDEIYIEIINELDLKNINITKFMVDYISLILNANEYYIIKNQEDLNNESKINFYYILLKYILKNSIYIYNIPILLQNKELIVKSIKSFSQLLLYYKTDRNKNDKLIYILYKFTDSKYYINKYIHLKKDSNPKIKLHSLLRSKSINNSIRSNLSKTNSRFIKDSQLLYSFNFLELYIEECFNNFNYYIYFNKKKENNSEKTEDTKENNNDRYYYIKDEIKKLKDEKLDEEDIKLLDNFMALTNFIDKIENYVKNNSVKLDEFQLKLIFNEDKVKGNNNLRNVNCEYEIKSLYLNLDDEKNKYQDKDILNRDDNINNFKELFNRLNPLTSLSKSKKINFSNISSIPLKDSKSLLSWQRELKTIASNEHELSIEIIGKHDISANYIKELSNGLLISGGPNKLIVYNGFNNYKEYEIKISNDNICEIEEDKDKMINVLICSENEIKLLKIRNDSNYEYSMQYAKDKGIRICFQFNKDYIVCNQKGVFIINDFLSKIASAYEQNILNNAYFTGIRINNKIIALTSNKNDENGKDKIIFFNYYSRRIVKSIENYSFALSHSSLALMPREETNKKILLCACKKYKEGQKNGILLLKCDLNEDFKILSINFYETENFEVFCLCPISQFIDDLFILNKKKNSRN